ncbi:hypothetical protein HDU96_009302 [Phlyctochytrium bullatum]|nr:hypothetical protein HDU96_009302 [Phlyctochytrium bullatum]
MSVEDPKEQQLEEDNIMNRKERNEISIWSVMSSTEPEPETLKALIKKNNGKFQEKYGHHMLFERASEGETILHYALLRKQEGIVQFLLEDKEVVGDDIRHQLGMLYTAKYG